MRKPNAPSKLKVVINNSPSNLTVEELAMSFVTLNWQDNSSNEISFEIERCTGASCTSFVKIGSVPTNVVTYSDFTVIAGNTYRYRVRATNNSGDSGYSNVVSVTIPATPPPPPPTYSLVVVNGSGSGLYTNGTTVPIIANSPPSGDEFSNWTGATVASPSSASTTITMPSANTTVTANYIPLPPPPPPGSLITVSNQLYLGAGKLPASMPHLTPSNDTFDGSGGLANYPVCYNPANNSLIAGASATRAFGYGGEFAIPILVNTQDLSLMNRGVAIQGMYDLQDNRWAAVGTNLAGYDTIGGLYIENGKLYISVDILYDAGGPFYGTPSYLIKPSLDLSINNNLQFNYRLSANGAPGGVGIPFGSDMVWGGGFTFNSITPIPASYQAALGATHLAGGFGLSILSRGSTGPAIIGFNLADLSAISPIPSTGLVYYTATNPIDPAVAGKSNAILTPGIAGSVGIIFPTGFRSILVIGSTGRGNYGYGAGTNDCPNPAMPVLNTITGTDASTDSTGTRVTLPNKTTADGRFVWVWLHGQPTPIFDDGSHAGCAQVFASGNSGLSNAYVDINPARPLPANLSGISYNAGELNMCDPLGSAIGGHAYPYRYWIWAYDYNDLVAVKNGTKLPWQVFPYANWELVIPFPTGVTELDTAYKLSGLGWDILNRILYVLQYRADSGFPVVHGIKFS